MDTTTCPLPLSLQTRAHKLLWYGESCIALSETHHARAKRILRELAVDLLIEAEKQRLLVRRRDAEALELTLSQSSDSSRPYFRSSHMNEMWPQWKTIPASGATAQTVTLPP